MEAAELVEPSPTPSQAVAVEPEQVELVVTDRLLPEQEVFRLPQPTVLAVQVSPELLRLPPQQTLNLVGEGAQELLPLRLLHRKVDLRFAAVEVGVLVVLTAPLLRSLQVVKVASLAATWPVAVAQLARMAPLRQLVVLAPMVTLAVVVMAEAGVARRSRLRLVAAMEASAVSVAAEAVVAA